VSQQNERDRELARSVVSRLRTALGVARDTDIGPALGRKTSVAGSWIYRGQVPRDVIQEAARLTGRSERWLAGGVSEGCVSEYRVTTPSVQADVASSIAPLPDGAAQTAARHRRDGHPQDERLSALLAWLEALWAESTEEERAWLIVELRMLRGRLREGG
jgi:hypothetical protein